MKIFTYLFFLLIFIHVCPMKRVPRWQESDFRKLRAIVAADEKDKRTKKIIKSTKVKDKDEQQNKL